ncbi:MAG TPA: phosphoribosylformylglycinamidine synthase subunit PurL, partial [Acidobacteriaceae bacterium]|nr:phosphoribosylformylglycinamidine synthase subunit PurL [Acidobacteriaceae bacterium]
MKSPAAVAPSPATITPELLARHGITPDEYRRIQDALGRTPGLTELGIYSVMWSEHCSYKSSKVHLKRLPTRSKLVVQGPGENAGIIDVGDGWACAFKIESHNHPSYIEPYQGAATGVGGILRDIFTMGARPLAVMDSLRFGPLTPDRDTPEDLFHRNHSVVEGVVHGIAGYGNCFGVPNLGGETKFEPCYSGNPLVNAFALGLVRRDEIFYAKASGIGNPVIYVGARTGRDGIHGATMASEEFREGSEQKRPNVQVGDPFMEKLLLEACLEAMKTGAVVGIQDMGAAGLTCSTCEMGARGGVGLEVELDHVPQRETGMSAYEIMLSESQERMLLVAEKGREHEVLRVFDKWGLEGVIVGTVIPEPRLRIFQHGELVADIPNRSLTDDAPVYHRPVGTWSRPDQIKVPLDPPPQILEELKKPRDYTADLRKLLASPNICSKRWVYEQYDSMVQTNTVQGPGGEAGVMRIKNSGKPGHERGLAMALAGNGRWCYLDPKLGAMLAVAEAARKVACTGATPVAATNCLNFGNPEKPEIMAQLSAAIDGIAEACTALGTPITGGNVSLYNETKGEGIYPTPVVGVVGIIDDVTKAVPAGFGADDKLVLLLGSPSSKDISELQEELGSSEFAKTILGETWGRPPRLDLDREAKLQAFLRHIVGAGLITSAQDVASGGIAVALAKACIQQNVGIHANLSGLKWANQGPSNLPDQPSDGILTESALFGEHSSMVLVSGSVRDIGKATQLAQKSGIP